MDSTPPRRRSAEMQTTAELLEEILSGGVGAHAFTADQLKQLERVRGNQERSARILRAVRELLVEKGVLSRLP